MTCGIYLLTFGDNLYYVGLSKNIEDRFTGHLNSLKYGTATTKMLDAFELFGAPTLTILEICEQEYLAEREKAYIEKYDSYYKGLNSNKGGGTGANKDYESKIDKFTKVFITYLTNRVSTERLAEYVELQHDEVIALLSGRKFNRFRDYNPELYDKALGMYKINNTPSKAKQYPPIIHNETKEVVNIPYRGAAKFAKERGIAPGNLSKLLNGEVRSCSGWFLAYQE